MPRFQRRGSQGRLPASTGLGSSRSVLGANAPLRLVGPGIPRSSPPPRGPAGKQRRGRGQVRKRNVRPIHGDYPMSQNSAAPKSLPIHTRLASSRLRRLQPIRVPGGVGPSPDARQPAKQGLSHELEAIRRYVDSRDPSARKARCSMKTQFSTVCGRLAVQHHKGPSGESFEPPQRSIGRQPENAERSSGPWPRDTTHGDGLELGNRERFRSSRSNQPVADDAS